MENSKTFLAFVKLEPINDWCFYWITIEMINQHKKHIIDFLFQVYYSHTLKPFN